jgi:DNA-binding LacI/PurR family transcriptional regulator
MKTKRNESNLLYLRLKNIIYENVFNGKYRNNTLIPTERELSKQYNMSRITVRSALEMLDKEGFIVRTQGRGTAISLKKSGTKNDMGIIAVVAPNKIPFFSSFIEAFNDQAENNDSLVLIKTQSHNKDLNIEKYLYKLFIRNVRNVVLWLHDSTLDMEYISRLRGMGMNFVFFDIIQDTQYGDGVCLDNKHAIETLCSLALKQIKDPKKIAYIGWGNKNISSVDERESTFTKCTKNTSPVYYVPWESRWQYRSQLIILFNKLKKNLPSAFICVNGEIGIELKKILNENNHSKIPVYCVDEDPEAEELKVTTIDQSINKMAEKVFECLREQNQHPFEWKPKIHRLKGTLIKR